MKTADLIWLGQRLAEAGRAEMRANAAGVPAAELIVMRHLMENPPSTITALAGRTGYAQSRVSTAVSALVSRGWAETRADPADGRRTLVSVPGEIRQSAQRYENTETSALAQLLAEIPPARRQAITGALEDLLEVLRGQPDGEPPG